MVCCCGAFKTTSSCKRAKIKIKNAIQDWTDVPLSRATHSSCRQSAITPDTCSTYPPLFSGMEFGFSNLFLSRSWPSIMSPGSKAVDNLFQKVLIPPPTDPLPLCVSTHNCVAAHTHTHTYVIHSLKTDLDWCPAGAHWLRSVAKNFAINVQPVLSTHSQGSPWGAEAGTHSTTLAILFHLWRGFRNVIKINVWHRTNSVIYFCGGSCILL